MFQNLKLRAKLVAIVAPPLFVLAVVAAYAVLLSSSSATVDELTGDIRTLGVVALAAFLLSALTVVVVGRTITNPLDDVSASARELAENRIPALVDTLRNPGAGVPTFEPMVIEGADDEVKTLVDSLNSVQEGIAGLAEEQRNMVRRGLSELVINLARRNQSLLDRQIEVIDRLEHEEEDPDRLQELFNLDHLATRMRRNAESLLVVAGAEPVRRRGGPVEVADALRVAMSEIEDYRHVHLVSVEDAQIGAQSAVDLAHLFSELLENATQFSPPDSPVEVTGVMHPDGSYLISCVDHGIGMTAEQLANANHVLQHPPELGLGLTRSLGFIVIGRLAERLGVTVELTHTPDGGITAIADIPATVLAGNGFPSAPQDAPADAAPAIVPPAPVAGAGIPASLGGAPAGMPPAPDALDGGPVSPDADPFAPAEETWTPPAMPERDPTAFGGAPAAPAPAPAADPFADEESWTPPAMPERDPTAFGGAPAAPAAPTPVPPAFDTPPAPAPAAFDAPASPAPAPVPPAFDAPAASAPAFDAPAPAAEASPAHLAPDGLPASDALAKLLGVSPSSMTADTPAQHDAPAEPVEEPWVPPSFDPADAGAPLGAPPAKLEEAIPTGDSFDAGVDSLLDESARTPTGLVKRDRSVNHAPKSEGRKIAASNRSPDEIRSMLARYRSGLKGKPLEEMASPPMPGADAPSFDMPGQRSTDAPFDGGSFDSFSMSESGAGAPGNAPDPHPTDAPMFDPTTFDPNGDLR